MPSDILTYANHFRRLYAQMFQPLGLRYGLNQLEIDILLFLHNNPAYNTARDIAQRRGFAPSNVSTAVDALRKKGLLATLPDPDSRRVLRLRLTAGAGPVTDALALRQRECFALVADGFSPEERELFFQFLRRMDQNVQRALDRKD